jgi:hypothetical protein
VSANPPPLTSPASNDPLSAALILLLGPWGALAALAYRFGSPWVAKIIENSKLAADPSVEEWYALDALIDTPGEVLIPKRAQGFTTVAPTK